MLLNFLVNFLIALFLTVGSGLLSLTLAKRFNLIDQPHVDTHKQHARATPLAGGITLGLALVLTIILRHAWLDSTFFGLFAAAIIVFLFGLWDDAVRLTYWVKLIGQLLAGLVLISSGTAVHLVKAAGWEWLNWGITLFWVVGIINGVNFVDSFDHLSIGIVMTILAGLLIGTMMSEQYQLLQLITILLGIVLVLYFFNTTPAMMFLGDSGAQLLGLFVAVLAILFNPTNSQQSVSWFAPILLAGIPIFDTTLVVFSRLRRRKRVYRAGLDHTWHRLVALGLGEHRAVQLMHLASLVLVCLALLTLLVPRIFALVIFSGALLVGFCLILYLDGRKRWA